MKRLLIFCNLIILCIVATPITTYADPAGFGNSIPFYNDGAVIDETLNNFPATFFISESSGKSATDISCVFDELKTDANRKKIAITKADKATQAYIEIPNGGWDTASKQATLYYSFGTTFTDYTSSKQSDTLWLVNKRAARFGNYSYMTYLDFTAGAVMVKQYDLTTKLWSTPVQLSTVSSANAHRASCIAVDSDGYIFVAFGTYEAGGSVKVFKSTNPNDISAWGSVQTAASGYGDGYYSYVWLGELSNKDMVCLYRARNSSSEWTIHRVVRNNGTGTWDTANDQLIVESNAANDRPYYDECLSGDKLHIAYHVSDASETPDLNHDLYYISANQVSGGTTITSPTWSSATGYNASLPIYEWGSALVYDSDADWDALYLTAIDADSSGNPYIFAGVHDATATDALRVWQYDAGWDFGTVISDNGVFTERDATTGISVADGDLYVESATAYSAVFTNKVGSYNEIQEYRTTDSGASWSKLRDITSSSTRDWVCPTYPENLNDQCRVIAWQGDSIYHTTAKDVYSCGSDTNYQMVHIGYDLFYFWYDLEATDNTSYVGDAGDAVAQNVWTGYSGVWHMEGTTCYDSSSNSYDLTDNGPTQTTGAVGHGQDFVRSESDYLSASGVTLPDPGSLEFWFNPDNSEEDNLKETIFSFDESGTQYFLLHKRADNATAAFDNTFGVQMRDAGSSSYDYILGATGWVQNETHHCLISWSGTTVSIYIDGINKALYYSLSNDSPPDGTGTLNFGVQSLGGSRAEYYDGMLDEARLSSSARSAAWAKATAVVNDDDLFYFFPFTLPEITGSQITINITGL